MNSIGQSHLAPIPDGVPADLAEHYQYATKFIASYADILECLPTCNVDYRAPDEEKLQRLIDAWNTVSVLMSWSWSNLFPAIFLDEVDSARKEYTGAFIPETLLKTWDGNTSAVESYNSAFHFVEKISSELMSCADSAGSDHILKRLVRSRSNRQVSIVELQPKPKPSNEQYDLELAYLLGSLARLEYLPPAEDISEELRREILAVSKKRSEGQSWQAIGDSFVPDSGMTLEELSTKLEEAGPVKVAILNGLLDVEAIGSGNAVSAPMLAKKLRMENDSTFKSHLSWLRDLRLVGGKKGQRGYWIDERCRDELLRMKATVGNQVRN